MKTKEFINKILQATAIGIIIGLIPNAVLSSIFKFLPSNQITATFSQAAVIFQASTPLIIGVLMAQNFGLKQIQMMSIAGATFVGSGVISFNPEIKALVVVGIGDIINTMLVAAIATILTLFVKDRFGSAAIILAPICIGCFMGFLGLLMLPYIKSVTVAIGIAINSFTNLHPILMSILISCSFAILIISPTSTVVIALAIGLNGIAAGAAAMGVAATTIVLIINSWKVNKTGVTIAISLGAMKMMMPNLFRKPVILLPCLLTASICGALVAMFEISGTPMSAGFGLVGLIGPMAALSAGQHISLVLITWFLIPIFTVLTSQILFEKVFKIYDRREVFEFLEN